MSYDGHPIQLLDGTIVRHDEDGEPYAVEPAASPDGDMPTFESFAAAVPLANERDYEKFCDDWRGRNAEQREKLMCWLADEAALNAEAKRAHDEALVKARLEEPKSRFDEFADQLQKIGDELLVDEPADGDAVVIDVPEDEEPKQ